MRQDTFQSFFSLFLAITGFTPKIEERPLINLSQFIIATRFLSFWHISQVAQSSGVQWLNTLTSYACCRETRHAGCTQWDRKDRATIARQGNWNACTVGSGNWTFNREPGVLTQDTAWWGVLRKLISNPQQTLKKERKIARGPVGWWAKASEPSDLLAITRHWQLTCAIQHISLQMEAYLC